MQSFFFEQPIALAVSGLICVGLAAFAWAQTGKRPALITAVALLALTVIGVIVSVQVRTDREKIKGLVEEVAALVEINDFDGVKRYLHKNAAFGMSRFETELPRYKFEEARVTRFKSIAVNPDTVPETAVAQFNVFVKVVVDGQPFSVPRFVKTYLMKEGEAWKVRDFEHYEATAGFRDNLQDGPSGTPQGIPGYTR